MKESCFTFLCEMLHNLVHEQQGDRLKFVFSPDVIPCGLLGSKHQLANLGVISENIALCVLALSCDRSDYSCAIADQQCVLDFA